jgi:hypothetical protein
VAGTALQFIFPILTHFACFRLKMPIYKIVLNIIILIIGGVGGIYATYYSILAMAED